MMAISKYITQIDYFTSAVPQALELIQNLIFVSLSQERALKLTVTFFLKI